MEWSLKGDRFVSSAEALARILSSARPDPTTVLQGSSCPSLLSTCSQHHHPAVSVAQALARLSYPASSWQLVHSFAKPGSIPVCTSPFSRRPFADMTAFHLSPYRNISLSVLITSLYISLAICLPMHSLLTFVFPRSHTQLRFFLLSA